VPLFVLLLVGTVGGAFAGVLISLRLALEDASAKDLRSQQAGARASVLAVVVASACRCFTTDSLPRGYPGQLFGLRRIAEFGGYAKRLTIYTGLGPRLGRVITLRPVLALACLHCIALSIGYAFSSYNGYPHQPFIV